jgi:hypothetical protein
MTSAASVSGSRRCSHGGGPISLLLAAPGLPRPRPAGAGQSDRLRLLRQDPVHPVALLLHLQGPLLRAQGHSAVSLRTAAGEGPRSRRAPRRPHRGAGHGAVDRREPQYGGPLQPTVGRSRPGTPRRARGFFPLGPVRSSSMRSGRMSPRNRSTATPPTRPMTSGGIGGTTPPTTRSTSWSSASSPGRGAPRRRRPWSPTSSGGRRGGP